MFSSQLSLWDQDDIEADRAATPLPGQVILDQDGEVIFYPQFFDRRRSDTLYSQLMAEIPWRQEAIAVHNRHIPLPRLTAWHGDPGKTYTYSGLTHCPEPWTPTLELIKTNIEPIAGIQFNSVLLNLYRDGRDSVSWHSDNEVELGQNPLIGSVSFGGTRRFTFRHKQAKHRKLSLDLTHGSFLLMRGATQHYWDHQVTKTAKPVAPRINLTFRVVRCST